MSVVDEVVNESYDYSVGHIAFEDSKGKVTYKHMHMGCHGFMSGAGVTGKEVSLVQSLRPRGNKEAFEEFGRWLCSKESPYKEITHDAELLNDKQGNLGGVRIQLREHCAPFLVNFLVATRMPWEHYGNVNSWWKMVQAGLSGKEAFYAQNQVTFHTTVGAWSGAGHYPMDSGCDWSTIRDSKPNLYKVTPYLKDKNYIPCNMIWENKKRVTTDFNIWGVPPPRKTEIEQAIRSNKGLINYTGSFKTAHDAWIESNKKTLIKYLPEKDALQELVRRKKELFPQ